MDIGTQPFGNYWGSEFKVVCESRLVPAYWVCFKTIVLGLS